MAGPYFLLMALLWSVPWPFCQTVTAACDSVSLAQGAWKLLENSLERVTGTIRCVFSCAFMTGMTSHATKLLSCGSSAFLCRLSRQVHLQVLDQFKYMAKSVQNYLTRTKATAVLVFSPAFTIRFSIWQTKLSHVVPGRSAMAIARHQFSILL